MTRRWRPDPGWTGNWNIPDLLTGPLSETDRAALAAMVLSGYGPKRLAASLDGAMSMRDVWDEHPSRTRMALRIVAEIGARMIVPSDDEYPTGLSQIDAPPLALFVKGSRFDELGPRVAIVGARACTSGGSRFAERLGEAFASAGYTVVSGLARGVDVAAHRGALRSGATIAVLGTGVDVVYPPEHRELATAIASSGALCTEFAPEVGPRAWHFPARNRIIAGLCEALIVVEAGMSSGALITAGFALDAGRHVLACITGPENPAGIGVRELMLDGAEVVIDPEQAVDLVSGLLGEDRSALRRTRSERDLDDLSADEVAVLAAVTEGITADAITANCGRSRPEVLAALAMLELEGLVSNESGLWRRTYSKTADAPI